MLDFLKELDANEIKAFYESIDTVWPKNNRWHDYNQSEIKNYIHRFPLQNRKILNAGSGGNDYGLNTDMCHLDIAENKIENAKNYVVGSIERMPFDNNSFDVVICVGSVLNYCDAVKAINEMARVLKNNGVLILEFENSYSFEFKNTTAYKAAATVVTTEYFNAPHKMWVYSLDYIREILCDNNLVPNNIYPYHILSSFAYFYSRNENKAAKYAPLDKILRHIPIVRKHSGNVIISCKKR